MFLPLVGWTFKIIQKNWVFVVILQNFGGIHLFLKTRISVWWPLCHVFITLTWLSYCDIFIYMYKYRNWFRVNQRCSALKILCFRVKKISADSELIFSETALNFSVLNSADSEKVRADQAWNSADAFHVLWISTEKRQISEIALFSPDYFGTSTRASWVRLLSCSFSFGKNDSNLKTIQWQIKWKKKLRRLNMNIHSFTIL